MNLSCKLLASLAALAALAPSLRADTLQTSSAFALGHTNTLDVQNVIFVAGLGNSSFSTNKTVTLNKFNPALGTLNSATFSFVTTPSPSAFSATLHNSLVSLAANYELRQSFGYSLSLPNVSSALTVAQTNAGSVSLGVGGTTSVATNGPAISNSVVYASPAQLGSLTGAGGTFGVDVSASDAYHIDFAAGLVTKYTLTGGGSYAGTVTVTYNYTPAPVSIGFTNSASITIPASGPASAYSSDLVISGFTGKTISKVKVNLNGFGHFSPNDVDILLVGPGGQNVLLMSDVGGASTVSGVNLVFDDHGAALSSGAAVTSGTYRPSNEGSGDTFSAPAPAVSGSALSVFNGTNPNGTWKLFIVDDTAGNAGVLNGGWSLSFETESAIIVSEFRLKGPNGSADEFIEFYNTTDAPYTVTTADGSAGWSVVNSDGVVLFTIPTGTVIPPHGHYLAANSGGYSLNPAGDITYTTGIADQGGFAVFNTANSLNFSPTTRLDAAGYSTVNELYRLGAGLPTGGAEGSTNPEYSFLRNQGSGSPDSTGSSVTDFLGVSTTATNIGSGRHLGAPGPESSSSPANANGVLSLEGIDPAVALTNSPNWVSNGTAVANGPLGTYSIRRKITNLGTSNITSLRFRIVDISSLQPAAGDADLRALTSGNLASVSTSLGNVSVAGTTLDTPPAQPLGGGWNSTLSVPGITAGTPLAPGASINVQFVLGIQTAGNVSFVVSAEASPVIPGGDGPAFGLVNTTPVKITGIKKVNTEDAQVTFTSVIGRNYRLEKADGLTGATWYTAVGGITALGTTTSVTNYSGFNASVPLGFYRVRILP